MNFGNPDIGTHPVLLLRSVEDNEEGTPVVVTPGSQLELTASDQLYLPSDPAADPDPPYYSLTNEEEPVTYLYVEFFTGGSPTARLFEESSEVEFLDLPLGVPTAQLPAPPVFSVSRLTVEAGMSAEFPVGTALLFIEAGAVELAPNAGHVEIQRAGVNFEQSPELAEEGDSAALALGDAAVIPLGSTGAVRNTGDTPVSLLSVILTP